MPCAIGTRQNPGSGEDGDRDRNCPRKWHLVVPYTLCTNDSKFAPGRAFSTSDDFFAFIKDAVDALLEEAATTGRPKMLSVGLHPRLVGHPARILGLQRVLDYLVGLGNAVWVCQRGDIAKHWIATHPAPADPPMPVKEEVYRVTVAANTELSPLLSTAFPSHENNSKDHQRFPVPSGAISDKGGKRLLVTGGAGFVLSNLVDLWLRQDLTASVVIFDRPASFDASVLEFLREFAGTDRLGFHGGDVASDAAWDSLAAEHGRDFTHIVSGAAITPTVEEELRGAERILEVNMQGNTRALEFARTCRKLSRFVHVSSDAVLGVPGLVSPAALVVAAETPTTTDGCLPSMSLYALAKVAGEVATRRWRDLFGIPAVSVRFSDVYGRLDRDTGARNRHNGPYWLCHKALLLERLGVDAVESPATTMPPICILGGSLDEEGWDIIDASSVARGLSLLLLCETQPALPVYHLGLGRTPTHREVVTAACARVPPHRVHIRFTTAAPLVDDGVTQTGGGINGAVTGQADLMTLSAGHWLRASGGLDIGPMHAEFGWCPTPLDQAIQAYMAHLRSCAT